MNCILRVRELAAGGLAIAVGSGFAPAAIAGPNYGVSLSSTAQAGGIYVAGGAGCTYDNGSTGGNCYTNTAHYGGQASATVTPTGGNGLATSATADENVSGAGAFATSRTTVDLSTATIGLYGIDSNVTPNCSTALPCGGTNNSASFFDTLHFTVAGANAATVTPITLTFILDGMMQPTGSSPAGTASGEIYGMLNFGSSDARFDLVNDVSTNDLTSVNYLDTYPSNYPGVWTTNANHTINTYTESYNIDGASQNIAIGLGAQLLCKSGMTCDYSNGLKLSLSLPATAQFTSGSGTFPSTTTGAVPEPATWAMMIAGFGVIGGTLRRQNPKVRFQRA